MRRAWYRRYLPGWIVTGGGGSGGAATVQTDGVTLQGDGSSGNKIRILQVETQARITGAGTVASPLDINPLVNRIYQWGNNGDTFNIGSANNIAGHECAVFYPTVVSNVAVGILTADASGLYDLGLYNSSNALVCHIGAQHLPSTGFQGFALVGAPVTIQPGLYYFAFTGNSNVAVLRQLDSNGPIFQYKISQTLTSTVSASGVLPNTITAPSVNVGIGNLQYTFY